MQKDLNVALKITADGKQASDELGRVTDGLSDVGDNAKAAADDASLLTTGLKGVAAALTVDFLLNQAAALASTADQYNNMAGRLKLVAGEGAGLEAALAAVRDTANASGAELDATATLYTRLSQATQALGLSQTDVIALTDTINKSFAVSGASSAEAEGAIRQFAQGLASGALRGDEFNSVMEQSPRLSQALAAGLGVGIGELRKMAEQGKLTAEVVTRALQSQTESINADFAKMPETIGRATQRMANEWTVFIGELDKTSGASAAVSSALNGVASNTEAIASAAVVAGEAVFAAFAVKAGGALVQYGKDMIAVRAASAATAQASIASGNAANWATLQAEKLATAELTRAKATQSATAAVLAEVSATSAAAQQAAIYGPQRAALEREVAAARTANAAATRAVTLAENQLLTAQKAGIAAAGALTAQTTANAGLMATAWGKVQGAAHGVMNAVRAIPTSWMVMIAVVGWEAGVAGVKKLAESLAELGLQSDGTRKRLQEQREEMASQAGAAASAAQGLSEYKDVTIQVAANVDRMSEAERARYASGLEHSKAYWEAVYREKALLAELGQDTQAAKEEAGRHLAAITAGLKDVNAAAALTREAVANLIDPAAARLLADFNAQVDELKTKGTAAGEAVSKALAAMLKQLDTESTESIRATAQSLDQLATEGTISAAQVGDAWKAALAKLSGDDLQKFALTAQAAFGDSARDATALAGVMDSVLRRAIAASGQDFSTLTTGISAGAANAIANVDLLSDNVELLGKQGVDTGAAIKGALESAIKSADTVPAINAVIERIKALGSEGKLTGAALASMLADAKAKADDLTPGIQSLKEAYKELGIQSKEALDAEAARMKQAYEYLKQNGASVEALGLAWAKYAEAAIAANGGVASSMIQAEAAQHGYTVSVDESGKAVLKLKDVIEDAAEAAVRAANAVRGANTQMMEAAAVAASQARTSIGSVQGSIDEFHAHMANLNRQATDAANAYNASFYEANKDIWDLLYDSQQKVIVGWDAVNAQNRAMENSAGAIRQSIDLLATSVKNVTTGTETMAWWGGEASKSYANTLKVAENLLAANQHLGAERLEPLRDAIADAKNRMLDLRAAAGDTLGAIQDEWDQLNNNLDEIEQRRADKRSSELAAQLAAARAINDAAAVADLTRAQTLLAQINSSNIKEAKTREVAAAEKRALCDS